MTGGGAVLRSGETRRTLDHRRTAPRYTHTTTEQFKTLFRDRDICQDTAVETRDELRRLGLD